MHDSNNLLAQGLSVLTCWFLYRLLFELATSDVLVARREVVLEELEALLSAKLQNDCDLLRTSDFVLLAERVLGLAGGAGAAGKANVLKIILSLLNSHGFGGNHFPKQMLPELVAAFWGLSLMILVFGAFGFLTTLAVPLKDLICMPSLTSR